MSLSKKDKKEVLDALIKEKERVLYVSELLKRFGDRKLAEGNHSEFWATQQGNAKKKIQSEKEYLDFYKEMREELS